MQVKSFVATIGLGMVAGAAAILMLPKHSHAYQMADETVQSLKMEAAKMMDSMRNI